jgi:FAD/FMN-containing dehydrogenase
VGQERGAGPQFLLDSRFDVVSRGTRLSQATDGSFSGRRSDAKRLDGVSAYRRPRGLSNAAAPVFAALLAGATAALAADEQPIVNDVSQLNPIAVERIVSPKSVDEIQTVVRDHDGPISIGGARHSMGGQIATEGAFFVDMRSLDRILALDLEKKTITVEAGITWRKIQEAIDPKGLAVKVMQSYSNFTVGGSLSVNAHGRYVGQGSLIASVRSIRLVLSDRRLRRARRDRRSDSRPRG